MEEENKTILQEAEEVINGQRRQDYGTPLESFTDIANIINVGLSHKLKGSLVAEDVEGLPAEERERILGQACGCDCVELPAQFPQPDPEDAWADKHDCNCPDCPKSGGI